MTPRRRSRKNSDLPANLYAAKGGYVYRHPQTKKGHGMGSDRAKAIAAAKILNERLVKADALVSRVMGGTLLADVLDRFKKEYLPDKDLSENYISQIEEKLERIKRELPDLAWDALDLATLTNWMKQLTRESYIKYRTLWVDIFRFACSVGLSEQNIAEMTLTKKSKKMRKRWTLETYRATYEKAEPWLQAAMDFAVTSLQRRIDLVHVHRKRDFEDGHMLVMQQKTGKRIAIRVGKGLQEVLDRARQLHPFCPFVVGHKPVRARKSPKHPKEHPYQVTTDYLTKAVAAARDASGKFDDWPAKERPTLHELRSLGAHLYEEAGFPKEYIQALLGHADQKTTDLYLSGYAVEWEKVAADLPLNYR